MTGAKSVQDTIHSKLEAAFLPHTLQLENESNMHNVPPGSESHFKLVLVSAEFEGKREVARHQAVYAVLAEELVGAVHALALHTFTPTEWQATGVVADSPDCLGGGAQE